MIPTSFAWLYEDLWHHRWLQLDERTFLKAKVLAVCATAVQSRILGPTKLLRLNTWNFQTEISMCFWLNIYQNCRTYSNILSHIVTRYEERVTVSHRKQKHQGCCLNWYQMISRSLRSRSLGVLESNFTFRSRCPSNISFEPLALHGHPGNFQWSLVTFSSLASVVSLKKNTHIGIAIYISYIELDYNNNIYNKYIILLYILWI